MTDTITEQESISPEIDLAQVKKRSVAGVIALTSRTFIVQIISFAATFLLTVFLTPEIYGTFFLVSAVINFLNYFSDIGLAAALIQKKETLSDDDLATTFTIQQGLTILVLIILLIATPYIRLTYHLTTPALYLLWALASSLFISSFKTIPTVLLERHLKFDKLIIPQIFENLVFNIVAVYLAWKGWGITTFTLAILAREVVGLTSLYLISPWTPKVKISQASLHKLLHFGVPYQINTLLAVVKDDGMTVFLGGIIGSAGLGYIGWASRWANQPLRFFMDNLTRVAFPAYSRVQHDKALLKRGIEKVLFYLALICFPIFVGMGILAGPLVTLIPKYQKWEPALIPLYLYLLNAAFALISTPLTNALNAVGHIKTTFKLMIMWTALTWALMPLMAIKFGYLGVAGAAGLIAISSVVVFVVVTRLLKLNILGTLTPPIVGSILMGLFLFLTRGLLHQLIVFPVFVILAAIIYFTIIYLFEGKKLFVEIKSLISTRHENS